MQHKPQVLAAFPPFALERLEKMLAGRVELLPATAMQPAMQTLERDLKISLVICGVHFDGSRMYDLLRYVRTRHPRLPFLCCRILNSELPQISGESITLAAQSLGAAGYADLPALEGQFGEEEAEARFRSMVLEQLPLRRVGNGG